MEINMDHYSQLIRTDILQCSVPFVVTTFLEIVFILACIFLFKRISKLGKAICAVLMLFPAIILAVNIANNLPELTRMMGDYACNEYRECTGVVTSVRDIKNSYYSTVVIDGREYYCQTDSSAWFGDRIKEECRIVYGGQSAFIVYKEPSASK